MAGRRPLSGERKTGELVIRLSDSERAELDRAAGQLGTSTWARTLILRAARAARSGKLMMPNFKSDDLLSDAAILKIPGINTSREELSDARRSGKLCFVNVPKRGPHSSGRQLAEWLEKEKGFQP